MRQTELCLSKKDCQTLEAFRAQGLHRVRETNRAHILAALHRKVPENQIMAVLGVGRTAIGRTRAAYLQGGLTLALYDDPRPGQPKRYQTNDEAEVVALACSAPPEGATRWTVARLTEAVRQHPRMARISRESVRRFLKKTTSDPGAK